MAGWPTLIHMQSPAPPPRLAVSSHLAIPGTLADKFVAPSAADVEDCVQPERGRAYLTTRGPADAWGRE